MNDKASVSEIVSFCGKAIKRGNIPPIWSNGHINWKFDETNGVYFSKKYDSIEFCLGDRYCYLHWGYGSIHIRGSSSENWHGYSFDADLKEAIEWLKETEYSDLGYLLWTGMNL